MSTTDHGTEAENDRRPTADRTYRVQLDLDIAAVDDDHARQLTGEIVAALPPSVIAAKAGLLNPDWREIPDRTTP